MKKYSDFFERILQIIEYYGIKSVNSFACDFLKYESSEKINRLKKENANPSYEILLDISNKFEDIDMNWLIAGRGSMLKTAKEVDVKEVDNEWLLRRFEEVVEERALLKKENEELKLSRGNPINDTTYPISKKIGSHIAAEPGAHKHT